MCEVNNTSMPNSSLIAKLPSQFLDQVCSAIFELQNRIKQYALPIFSQLDYF